MFSRATSPLLRIIRAARRPTGNGDLTDGFVPSDGRAALNEASDATRSREPSKEQAHADPQRQHSVPP